MSFRRWTLALVGAAALQPVWAEPVAVATTSNAVVRIVAANLSSGTGQNYDAPGIRILQGLKPDIVAIQEFNYGNRSAAAIQSLVDQITRTNGSAWFRESGAGYTIPNGVISRWPITQSGSWDDLEIPDRGFAWARIDVPGTNDLYVVSVHLKASNSTSDRNRRNNQALQLKSQIATNFPANAWVVVAGDLNTYSTTEAAIATLGSFLDTAPFPTDQQGDPDTNAGRSSPYDHLFANFTFSTNQIPTVIGAQSFADGLVFDTRVFTPLADAAPAQVGDSGVSGMQHMAVVKDFRIQFAVTNLVDVPAPQLTLRATNQLEWSGPSNLNYRVEGSVALPHWSELGAAWSATTNYAFTNAAPGATSTLYRVRIP